MSTNQAPLLPYEDEEFLKNYILRSTNSGSSSNGEEAVVSSTTSTSPPLVSSTTPTMNLLAERHEPRASSKSTSSNMPIVEYLPSGQVRYGPITVRPRKKPSKTLFTGRRSKNEVLHGDAEAKRQARRERNRIAATKCREKREFVLGQLERDLEKEMHRQRQFSQEVEELQQRKIYLENLLTGHQDCRVPTRDVVSVLPALSNSESNSYPMLINSSFDDPSFRVDLSLGDEPMVMLNSSSLERLLNDLSSTPLVNPSTTTTLFNSAQGSSTCAQQHSSSSEDEAFPRNSSIDNIVC